MVPVSADELAIQLLEHLDALGHPTTRGTDRDGRPVLEVDARGAVLDVHVRVDGSLVDDEDVLLVLPGFSAGDYYGAYTFG